MLNPRKLLKIFMCKISSFCTTFVIWVVSSGTLLLQQPTGLKKGRVGGTAPTGTGAPKHKDECSMHLGFHTHIL